MVKGKWKKPSAQLRPAKRIHSPFTIHDFLSYADGAAGAGPATLAVFSVFSAFVPECPLNIRVGENSPSLCPTMFSVT